jgi:hypothetical protein
MGGICAIGGFLTAAKDRKFIVQDEGRSFGLMPLRLQSMYRDLTHPKPDAVPTEWKWNQGDIIDTQSLFSIVTPLRLDKGTVAEINVGGPRMLKSILDSCKTSPVFLSMEEHIYVVTTSVVNDGHTTWKGFDISDSRAKNPISWTEESLKAKAEGTTVLFDVAHETLAAATARLEERVCEDGGKKLIV